MRILNVCKVRECEKAQWGLCTYFEFRKVFMCITIDTVMENQKVQTLVVLHCPVLKISWIKGKFVKVWKKSCGTVCWNLPKAEF